MRILGNTLEEIAYQKAGIIKQNSNTVIYSQSERIDNIFINKCREEKNHLYIAKDEDIKNYKYDDEYQYFDYDRYKNVEINLKGRKQINNAAICIETIKVLNKLGYKVSENSIRQGLKTVIHKGRMEIVKEKPKIIFDGAHNEPAMQNLKDTIKMYYNDLNCKRLYIVSILKRKDYEAMLKILLEDTTADFIFTSGNDENKYAAGKELYDVACKYAKGQNLLVDNLESAIEKAMCSNYDVTFIVGSFYVYGDVVKLVKK